MAQVKAQEVKAHVDVYVENCGSLFTFTPATHAARVWITEHVAEDAQWLGGALCVEVRYARDLAYGMYSDGLTLE